MEGRTDYNYKTSPRVTRKGGQIITIKHLQGDNEGRTDYYYKTSPRVTRRGGQIITIKHLQG